MHLPRPARSAAVALALLAASCTGSGSGPTSTNRSPSPTALPPVAPQSGPPNVVVLLSDDQAFRIFDRSLMPNVFGQLVDQGVDFGRAYMNVSQCCPSRSSILTGLYSHDTGVDSNTIPLDGRTPIRPVITRALQGSGYRTGLFGKYLNSEPCSPQPGWDRWVCTQDTEIHPTLNVDGKVVRAKGFTADILARRAVTFIDQSEAANRPFFVYYSPKDPHLPANDPRDTRPVPPYRPPSYNALPDPTSRPAWARLPALSADQQAKIQNWHQKMTRQIPPLDRAMGSILSAVQSRAADTLVIFMSDNGFMYGEHRLTSKNQPYEESVRVPMVIRYPRLLPASRHFTSAALVSNVDLAPTIMDAAGIPWQADGVSLVPILSGQASNVRDGLLLEWCQAGNHQPCQSDKRAEELNVFNLPAYWGIETDRYVYIEYATGEEELYDLVTDPYEMDNLAGRPDMAPVKRDLSHRLEALRAPPPTPGTTIAVGPSGSGAAGPVSFVFFSQARSTTFRCSLGQTGSTPAPAKPCDSGTISYPSLAPGDYTFKVRAVDAQGHQDATPAVRRFVVSA